MTTIYWDSATLEEYRQEMSNEDEYLRRVIGVNQDTGMPMTAEKAK